METRTQALAVNVTLTERITVDALDVNALETLAWQMARRFLVRVARAVQEAYQRAHAREWERRDWRDRQLTTRLGTVRLPVLKVRHRTTGRCHSLLNDLLGLRPRQRCTDWVERQAVTLRIRGLSYRHTVASLGEIMGAHLSTMWLWRVVQRKGRQRRRQERAHARQIQARGRPSRVTAPEHLFLEADEIHVKAQRSPTHTHRIKVGVSYTGRRREPGNGRPRYRLEGKSVYGGVASPEHFGYGWFYHLEARHAVSRAPAVLYLSDDDPMLRHVQQTHFPSAIVQLDQAHVFRDLYAAAPDAQRAQRWIGQVCGRRPDLVVRSVRRHLAQGTAHAKHGRKVLDLLMRDRAALYGWRDYRALHDPQRTQRLPRATGAVEKNQEVLIGRVMKRRGMAWSARGANHLAKLIFAYQDPNTWNHLW